ncbi:MAG: PEP-CTERM sorting domain-containing protein [Akkermansiaceae bacterium]
MKLTKTSCIFAAALITGTSHAASIVYSFDSQSAAATSNDFGNGITGNSITLGDSMEIGSTQIDELDVASVKLGNTGSISFDVVIPNGVTVDFTELSFAFDYESNNNSGADYYADWTLAISTGSGTASGGPVGPYASGQTVISTAASSTLSGLTGLTDTTVTFTLSADNGTDTSLTGGNANDRRTIFDDVTLTGAVVPEPSAVSLLGFGFSLLLLNRRRSK